MSNTTKTPPGMTEGFVSYERLEALGIKRPESVWDVAFMLRMIGIITHYSGPLTDMRDFGPWSIEDHGVRFTYVAPVDHE